MKTYNAILADDEENLCTHLAGLLHKLWPELQILGIANTGSAALDLIKQEEPEIAFLDIKMPDINGIDVATQCSDICRAVFITAYDEFAIQAFEQDAIDYLLKPVNEDRLLKTIDRLKTRLSQHESPGPDWKQLISKLNTSIDTGTIGHLQWIRAGKEDKTILIPVEEVLYFKAEDKYTTVVIQDGEYLIRKPVKELAIELNKDYFWQINRGIIVNAKYIASSQRELSGQYTLQLKNHPNTLVVSRNYAQLFKQM